MLHSKCMPADIGIWEILVLVLVLLIVFGPKRLPEMGRQLGKGMREFKGSLLGENDGQTIAAAAPESGATPESDARDRDTIA